MDIRFEKNKKILFQLQNEIKTLEKQIKYYKFNKVKNKVASKFKLYSKTIQKFIPCMIVTGFSVILIKSLSEKSFTSKIINNSNEIQKNDIFQNVVNDNHQNKDLKQTTLLYKYNKMENNNENKYKVTIYKVNDLNKDITNQIITSQNINLNKILGTPLNEFIFEETEKHQSKEIHYKIVSYKQNEKGEIFVAEISTESIIETIIQIIVISGTATSLNIELIKKIIINGFKNCNLYEIDNKNLDLDIITKKLVIKQNNYHKLIGDNNA